MAWASLLTDAILEEGLDQVFWYKEHLESVYCLGGEGTLEDLATGQTYNIKPGTLYALDKHDRHRLKVGRRMRVICTFVPPLVGGEMHMGLDAFFVVTPILTYVWFLVGPPLALTLLWLWQKRRPTS